ncbi:serine/threonine protein kinase [Nonomuraea roseola]|uniref:non-specific serine/threonine protein kinase n=1 Tax=Nonomuraea roseola TaxID=46179 RepID=A0ABV5PQF1_9ACTN
MDSSPRPGDPERLGDYAIVGRLGEGPRGAVYLGRTDDDEALRAIKTLPQEAADDGEMLDRLRGVKRVSSSYVARVLDVGVSDGLPYVVREHVEGRSLAETVEAEGPLSGDALERVAVGVLTALTSAHLAGVTHSGLTPHNVILGADGPRVTDAAVGEPEGELGYRSPEQIKQLRYGPPSDVFSWAATVVFAATGQAPFEHDAQAVLSEKPDVGALPQPLRRVVVAALSKEVAQRPTTYTALLQLLGDKNADKLVAGASEVAIADAAPPLEGTLRLPMYTTPESMPPQAPPAAVAPQWGPPSAEPPAQEPMHGHPVYAVPAQRPAPARRPFPIGLVAAMAAVILVSGLGLWGANRYAGEGNLIAATAADGTGPGSGVPAPQSGDQASAATDGAAQTQAEPPGTQQGQGKVTVPWATTPAPESTDVMPFELPTDDPSSAVPTPELTSITTAPPVPTQNIAAPPTTAAPAPTATVTVEATRTPSAKPSRTKESEQEEEREKPKPTPTQEQPSPTPTPTREKPTEEPSPTPSEEPKPTESKPAPKPTEPEPTPTKASPKPTPTKASPKPTPTTPKPTPTTPKPTPTTPKPTPTKSSAPPVQKTNPHTATSVCGGGYYVQRQASFAGGTTYQLYSNATGNNCVVTLKTTDVGVSTPVSATLEVQGKSSKTDSGNFEFYAGPVYLYGKGSCVKFSGSTKSGNTASDWGNCG